MPNLLGALWRPRSPRRTQARRDKPFRLQLKSLSLNRSTRSTTVSTDGSCGSSDTTMSGISASAKTFSNPGEGDVEMMSDGDGESLEVDSEDIDQQFDGESADGDIEDSLEDESEEEEDGNDVEVEETDDEVNYDANEALKIVDIDTQVDILSRRFEEQMISSREEKIHVEGNALNQKRAEGWAEDTLQLSLRMETRGLYPMLPIEWRRDFPYLSRHLFSANDEEVYLSPFARASVLDAFKWLFSGIQLMRNDQFKTEFGDANCRLWKRVTRYIKYTNRASRLRNDLQSGSVTQLLTAKWARKDQTIEDLGAALMNEFEKLSSHLLTLLRKPDLWYQNDVFTLPLDECAYIIPPPTLFGIAIHRPVVSILAYEPLSPSPKLREVAYLHISSSSYEMWNAFGIAVTTVHCRNNMLKIKEALQAAGLYIVPPWPSDDE